MNPGFPDSDNDSDSLQAPVCDLRQRSVRVRRRRDNGSVEFEFSVGWPELMVELSLPEAEFQEFCKTQQARLL